MIKGTKRASRLFTVFVSVMLMQKRRGRGEPPGRRRPALEEENGSYKSSRSPTGVSGAEPFGEGGIHQRDGRGTQGKPNVGGGGCSCAACRSLLTIDHATISRPSTTAPTPKRDASNVWALSTILAYVLMFFRLSYFLPLYGGGGVGGRGALYMGYDGTTQFFLQGAY